MSFPLRENWLLRCNKATESDDRKRTCGGCRGTLTVLTEKTGIFTGICIALKQSISE
jgi:hypothetical protein